MSDIFYSDFSGVFTKQSDGDIERNTDLDAIFNSISNIILTVQGERRFIPTFASAVKKLLFEPIDEITARLIAENLIESIKIWEPRVDITSMDIQPLYDQNAYKCRLNFTIVGSDQIEAVDFILTR